MMTDTHTDEQLRAIDTRSVSIALSAGAGCGKTHVLTERFLSHLAPQQQAAGAKPARLHQLVAITFTDAAAREMRTRIRNACYKRIRDEKLDSPTAAEWLRLLRSIESARISTIHAFCTALLRKHAVEAGLDPAFGVLDQGEADVLLSDVIDDVLRERLDKQDNLALDLAAALGLSRLKQQLQLLNRGRAADRSAQWLSKSVDEIVMTWRDYYARHAWPNALRAISNDAPIDQIIALLRDIVPSDKKPKFVEAKACLLDLLPKVQAGAIDDSQLATIRTQARVQSICSAKDWPSKQHYDDYSNACKAIRDAIDKHGHATFNEDAAGEAARLGLDLLQLTVAVADRYTARKTALGKLDFDDQLRMAHALITAPHNGALRDQLSADLELVLVDEFQDTDKLQVDLIKALCGQGFGKGRLFFVGDFKQSIYRFRGAQPDVFRDLENEVDEEGRQKLTVNFRSQPAILDFVNVLFANTWGAEYHPLRPQREQVTAKPAVEFLWAQSPDKNSNTKGAADAARRLEADWIARRLRALVDSSNQELPIVDGETGQPRKVLPGDIAILFRALSDVQVYEEALRRYELPYYLVGGHAYYAQQEVFDVLNLLRAVASRADEISLAGVLRSPFFSLEDETLFWLAEAGGINAGLFAEPPQQISDVERAKVTRAAATLRHLRAIKDRVPIAALLQEALARTGYDAILLAEFLGARKLANLRKLIERARAADHGGTLELDGFITQLGEFIAQQPKEALAATSAETAEVIRLMTIHQAKGLQFPLVVVPDLDRPPKLTAPPAALDDELGPVVALPSDDDREKATTGMSLFAARERASELEERKRLLYVACTRTRDHLILSSSLEACDAPKSDWMKLIADCFDLAAGELHQQLPPGFTAPEIRVTLSEPTTEQVPVGKSHGPDLAEMLNAAQDVTGGNQFATLNRVQPIAVDRAARRQFSFSRLTGKLTRANRYMATASADSTDANSDDVEDADFDGDTHLGLPMSQSQSIVGVSGSSRNSARDFGKLVHGVLERIDFAARPSAAELRAWCEHLAPLHVEDDEVEAAKLAQSMIERLLASPRGQQMAQATAFHRELEFLLAWPPERYLRGYIDCLYQDAEGGWRLVDYKTNDISSAECESIAKQYEMQLYVYAMAAERALGTSPTELALIFLRPGKEVTFDWNDKARQAGINMVNQAIDQLIQLTTDN